MSDSLQARLESVDSTVDMLRDADLEFNQYVFPDEHTNWIEEQRSVRESCAIVDQSYHMEPCFVKGPEAIDFLENIGVNSFSKIRSQDPPQAINLLMCNPNGYIIGDQILFYLGENEFSSVGSVWANNWIRYTSETLDYDVETETPYSPYMENAMPPRYRFQIQGPNALDVMEDIVDGSLPEISLFEMDVIEICNHDVYALGHGMAATAGLEIFGPYEYHGEVLDAILAAGEAYDIRQLGSKAYKTGKIGSGWLVGPVPAIYENEEMKGYREWLDAEGTEATFSIGGSFVSDDIRDYYMTPMERGQGHLVNFDHDFVGREALEEMVNEPQRQRVTFVWNEEDVIDVFASLFRDGKTSKFIDMPDTANTWSKSHYDKVKKDGEIVGLSKYPGYLFYEREMLSLGTIDRAYSDPGTEVTFEWGDQSNKQRVEQHKPVEIRATVAPAPYVTGGRESM
ncbi:aminomethyltransferase family protein [Halobellus limi]|uniref:Aminomethyl transferase family protein n=1 Tax=Halobellus limi TaxID=699433 RepID=A0A1H6BR60_9EURY|nr:aminomethyltransferase family protein [Halobellus limi]QCC49364.1 aminomethyl transferase family protein [Halobellus limi]SEG63173.1 vanillate/3-O-methylgallate O-demethylase [Halobellus limi]